MLRILLSIALITSCNRFVKMVDDSYHEKIDTKSGADHVKVVFSHNINGETHPCGCRKFPLGGLPQAAGYLHESKQDSNVIYVDSGDMLFPSNTVPNTLADSIKFTADALANAQDLLGLKFFTPGDQDFALGVNYLAELSKKVKFSFLISNAKKSLPIKSIPYSHVKVGDTNLVFLGIVNPDILSGDIRSYFEDPIESLKKNLEEVKKMSFGSNEKAPKLILLSHAGMNFDKVLAKKFPQIDWIIGSHSQAFLKEPETVGNVQIAQVLSRNHYMGEIKIPFNQKATSSYKLAAIDENSEKKMPNNPLIPWLTKYKSELEEVQKAEQKRLMAHSVDSDYKSQTYISCSQCHTKQTEFWQETAHSIAWQTLEKAKAANNSQCISCHSLDFGKPQGFASTEEIVQGNDLDEKNMDAYWAEVNTIFKDVHSVRELKKGKRAELSKKWMKVDAKHSVENNYANVQCMHCHNQHPEHPFQIEEKTVQKDYSKNCLQCHTADQSPEWYNKGDSGLATTVNKKYVDQKIKELSCPKM
ncbi:MAG: hypothetical protein KC478_00070 [Bacteriovoracaceae bacterium]|nr:hypothetical protein [Bacteriovoracaceae bacterium]